MLQSKQVKAKLPLPESTNAVAPVVCVGEYVTGATLPLNSIIEMTGIPAGHVPVDYAVFFEDLDSNGTPTITFTSGLLSGLYGDNNDARTMGTEFLTTNSTKAQTGGIEQNKNEPGLLLAPSNSDRGVGLKVTTAAATLVAGKKIRMRILCIPADGMLA